MKNASTFFDFFKKIFGKTPKALFYAGLRYEIFFEKVFSEGEKEDDVANSREICKNVGRETVGGRYGQDLCSDGQKCNRKGYGV